MTNDQKYPQYGWISCREISNDSRESGDVVVPSVIVREKSQMLGEFLGQISHGSRVTINEKDDSYFNVSFQNLTGWIQSAFVVWNWSTFTFFGKFKPSKACEKLDLSISDLGFDLVIKEDNFAIVTEGDPNAFDIIRKSIIKTLNQVLHAQAPLTVVPLEAEFTNWVEMPREGSEQGGVVGFLSSEDNTGLTISSTNIEDALSIAKLIKYSPYFDLALSDFYQALKYQNHALIFLARCIESLENSFDHLVKQQKGKGKEAVFRETLGLSKSDVEYVTRRANESHRRHASKTAKAEEIPHDELVECFKKTAGILSAYVEYLHSFGFK